MSNIPSDKIEAVKRIDLFTYLQKRRRGSDRVNTSCERLPRGTASAPSKRRVCVEPCRAVNAQANCA